MILSSLEGFSPHKFNFCFYPRSPYFMGKRSHINYLLINQVLDTHLSDVRLLAHTDASRRSLQTLSQNVFIDFENAIMNQDENESENLRHTHSRASSLLQGGAFIDRDVNRGRWLMIKTAMERAPDKHRATYHTRQRGHDCQILEQKCPKILVPTIYFGLLFIS